MADYTLNECPTPYPPFMAGAKLPKIVVTIPLDAGEDLTGSSLTMFLERPTDVLEKALTELENIAGSHAKYEVPWLTTDLVAGKGQLATFVLTRASGDKEPIARFKIDVFSNPDPTP